MATSQRVEERSSRRHGQRLLRTVVAIAVLAVAGCTSQPQQQAGHPPATAGTVAAASAPAVVVHGLPATRPVRIRDMGPALWHAPGNSPGALTFGSHLYTLSPSGPLPGRARIVMQLTRPAKPGEAVVVTTRERPTDAWTYLPAQLTPDRRHVTFTTGRFSWFGALFVDAKQIAQAFRKDFIDTMSSGVTATPDPPSCDDEQTARADGYKITSSTGGTVYWCFGYDRATAAGARVLKVVNNRRYPLLLEHPNMAVLRNEHEWLAAANLTRLDHRFAVVEPGKTVVFNADLTPGASEGVRSQADGLGQSLYQLQVGVETLLDILTRFGAGSGLKPVDVTAKVLGVLKCANTLSDPSSGALLANCLDAKTIAESFGPAGLLLAPAVAAGGLAQFFASEAEFTVDSARNADRYTILLTRASEAFGPFRRTWVAHTAQVTVSASGRVVESIGNGCCDQVIDLTYQLSNPRQTGPGAWVADATVTDVQLHDYPAGQTPPQVGRTYQVRVNGHHYYGLAFPGENERFCDPQTQPWDCGA